MKLVRILAILLWIPVSSTGQEQRLRNGGHAIPEPSEYWEELKPVERKQLPEKVEPMRVKPATIPAWQTRYTLGPGDTLNFSV